MGVGRMTILGKFTVAEAQALGHAVAYQFDQVEGAYRSISADWIQKNSQPYEKLSHDWAKAKGDWAKDWHQAQAIMAIKMGAVGPLVSKNIVPAQEAYDMILRNTAQGGRNGDDSLYTVNQKVEDIRKEKTDFSKQPSQMGTTDVDHGAY